MFQDLPCGVQTIQFWHANIQNQKIRFELLALLYRITSISGLSANVPTLVRRKKRAQAETEYRVIVNYQNAKPIHRTSPTEDQTYQKNLMMSEQNSSACQDW